MSARRGFTLIELLVVVAIIALLIGLAVPTIANALDAAARTASKARLSQFAIANSAFEMDFGEPALFPEMFDVVAGRLVRRGDRPAEVDLTGTTYTLRGFGVGGMSMHPLYKPQVMHEQDRLLNPYLIERLEPLPRGDSVDAISDDPDERPDRSFFRKPGRGIQLFFTADERARLGLGADEPDTLYEAAGTSYLSNTLWLDARVRSDRDFPPVYFANGFVMRDFGSGVDARYLFADLVLSRIKTWRQDRTVFVAEGSMILTAHQGRDPAIEQGVEPRREHQVVFLDGHARSVTMTEADVNRTRNPASDDPAGFVERRQGIDSLRGAPCGDDAGRWQFFPEFNGFRTECDGTPVFLPD